MNNLKNCGENLIGSVDDIKTLKEKDRAKILVISDTHGNYDALEDIILAYGPDCDALCFCGDGLCDIEKYIGYAFTEEKLKKALPPVVALGRGNGDGINFQVAIETSEEKKLLFKMSIKSYAELTVCEKKVMTIHGHQFSVGYGLEGLNTWASTMNANVVLFGHTHVPEKVENGNCLMLNPGSPSRPRSSSGPTLAVVTIYKNKDQSFAEFFAYH